jgi:tetraacyldisaccharide 4'-kinase
MLDRSELIKIISRQTTGWVAGGIRFCLFCLMPIYRVAIYLRNRRFDRANARDDQKIIQRAKIPVVSVGNLTTGGTGKTPLVIWIARYLRKRDLRVALISRGYGSDPNTGGRNDEALEIEHRLPDVPHLQDPNRFRMSQIAVEELESQVIVLDDAFQHRQLHRDLDIVLIDATAPFGFGYLLPRGLLREPVSSLRRADYVVLTRVELASDDQRARAIARIRDQIGDRPIGEVRSTATGLLQFDGQQTEINTIHGQPLFSFCGIGNPDNFAKSLQRLNLDVRDSAIFADHHNYSREDLNDIGNSAAACDAAAIVCTHKDLVKVGTNQLGGLPVYAVIIDVEWVAGQHELESCLDQLGAGDKLASDR